MAGSGESVRGGNCSIARSLAVLGERWTLLIVREAFAGVTRYADFRGRLAIASDVLAERLRLLVEIGVLDRRSYREPGDRERYSYHLTEQGRDLTPVLAAFMQWGDEYLSGELGPPALLRDARSGRPVAVRLVDDGGEEVPVDQVAFLPGPGATRRGDADRSRAGKS